MYSTPVLQKGPFFGADRENSLYVKEVTVPKHTAAEETSETAKGYMSISCTV